MMLLHDDKKRQASYIMMTIEIDSPVEINDIYGMFRLWIESSSAKKISTRGPFKLKRNTACGRGDTW